eukprot:TRINITY_DN14873_c0_g1_i1.p1 TRINITY_DN14873_c0_g1~~TRINITY_DN14873_c0_g1_i1.p1  ORF type:complete len:1143 (+),score=237.68 TRINITY_DN14873_c0_g1_i1:43-3471(+)
MNGGSTPRRVPAFSLPTPRTKARHRPNAPVALGAADWETGARGFQLGRECAADMPQWHADTASRSSSPPALLPAPAGKKRASWHLEMGIDGGRTIPDFSFVRSLRSNEKSLPVTSPRADAQTLLGRSFNVGRAERQLSPGRPYTSGGSFNQPEGQTRPGSSRGGHSISPVEDWPNSLLNAQIDALPISSTDLRGSTDDRPSSSSGFRPGRGEGLERLVAGRAHSSMGFSEEHRSHRQTPDVQQAPSRMTTPPLSRLSMRSSFSSRRRPQRHSSPRGAPSSMWAISRYAEPLMPTTPRPLANNICGRRPHPLLRDKPVMECVLASKPRPRRQHVAKGIASSASPSQQKKKLPKEREATKDLQVPDPPDGVSWEDWNGKQTEQEPLWDPFENVPQSPEPESGAKRDMQAVPKTKKAISLEFQQQDSGEEERTLERSGSKSTGDESDGGTPRGKSITWAADEDASKSDKKDVQKETAAEKDADTSEEDKRIVLFNKFKEHGEVHRDDLPKALDAAGFAAPNQAWIDEIFDDLTDYAAIELDDFLIFMQRYMEKQHDAYTQAFADCDDDDSGFVEAGELAKLLEGFGIQPLSHVLQEVINEVDEDGRGTLDLYEFKHLMDLIQHREGFTKTEYEDFLGIFRRFDRNNSLEIETNELLNILSWLGFQWTSERAEAVVSEVDYDGSCALNEREFLRCMRKVRETELRIVKQVMAEADADGSGTIDREETRKVLAAMGYDPWDSAVIDEAQKEAGLEHENELDLGMLWRLLMAYRWAEGFSKADVVQMDQVFANHDKDQSGELSSVEVSRALRDLGYMASFEMMQSLLSKVDVDDTGALDKSEFRKLLRMLLERESGVFREKFKRALKENPEANPDSKIPFQQAVKMVSDLGYTVSESFVAGTDFLLPGQIPSGKERLGENDFVRACCRHAREKRDVYRKNGGWDKKDVNEFYEVFKRYDHRDSKRIGKKDLVRLIDELFPELARVKSMRPQLQEMMQAAGQDVQGFLTFQGFLTLMRLFREFKDNERATKEMDAIKQTGFQPSDVQEYRDLFLESNAKDGELQFEDFRLMIHKITPLGDTLTASLYTIFAEKTERKYKADPEIKQADFPEFLLLIKHLVDINFARINEQVARWSTTERDSVKTDAAVS